MSNKHYLCTVFIFSFYSNSVYMSGQAENELKNALQNLQPLWDKYQTELNERYSEVETKLSKIESDRDDWKQKYDAAQSKINHIEEQLNSTVEQLESITKTKNSNVDALKLLDIYLVLMGEVFNSAAHIKILFILHGEKDEYKIEDIVKASGLGALDVKQAVFDLRNSNIVTYDDETHIVKLVNRFME